MDTPAPPVDPYQPSSTDKMVNAVRKRAPFYIGRAIQIFMFGLFRFFQFLVQMFHDAIGR